MSIIEKILNINVETRAIIFPSGFTNIGVAGDKSVLRLYFRMPRYYGGIDFAKYSVRVNYFNAIGDGGVYVPSDIAIGDDVILYSWFVDELMTKYSGDVRFNISIEDSNNVKVYNTTNAYTRVLEGTDPSSAIKKIYPAIVEEWKKELFGKFDGTIDSTLKISGMAADAYVVGDKIKKLEYSVSSPYNFKGSTTYAKLPSSALVNDTYYCTDKKCRYTYNGKAWYQSSLNENDYTDELTSLESEINTTNSVINHTLKCIATGNSSAYAYYYNLMPKLSTSRVYAIGITVSVSGTYTVQTGTYQSASNMVDAVGTNISFTEGKEQIIYGYTPSVDNICWCRLSDDVEWTLKLYELFTDDTNKDINSDINALASSMVSLISTGEYINYDVQKYPKKFDVLDPSKKYAIGVTAGVTGRYTVKLGTSGAEEDMVDTLCEDTLFVENTEKIIFGYTPTGKYSRARFSDNIDWEINIYEILDTKSFSAVNSLKSMSTDVGLIAKDTLRRIFSVTSSEEYSYYYNKVQTLHKGKTYALGITVSTSGAYDVQAGAYPSAAKMVDTMCQSTYFTENQEKIIYGYAPSGNYNFVRLSEPVTWTLTVYEVDETGDIHKVMANQYDNEILAREMYLRQYQHYRNDHDEIYYGVEWIEGEAGVTPIYSGTRSVLHETLPIQSKMRRCVVKDGIVQYYLHADNSTLKEDGTDAVLDGTDGDVCVEIPEFFFRFERDNNPNDPLNPNQPLVRLKISERGLDGYTYSPKMYIGAYEATINRNTNILASVCTTNFTTKTEEVIIESANRYTVSDSGYSLGDQTVVSKDSYTSNAAMYRGGNNDSTFDDILNPSNDDYWRNQLGLPVARMSRGGYRKSEDIASGKLMFLYDAHKALWILSTVEFKCKNIQQEIAAGGLGKGATTYFAYDAFKQWQKDYTESIIPCGVTNSLGNNSGEVFIKLNNVPVAIEGSYPDADISTIKRGDIWMPCMSYRGVEHYYGHLYKTVDQITISATDTGTKDATDNKPIFDVSYYYQKNPFRTDDLMTKSELIGTYRYCSNIRNTYSNIFGMDGHILPTESSAWDYDSEETYCDCVEINHAQPNLQLDVNGSILSGNLPGRNFLVGCFDANDEANARVSNGTRITYVCVR